MIFNPATLIDTDETQLNIPKFKENPSLSERIQALVALYDQSPQRLAAKRVHELATSEERTHMDLENTPYTIRENKVHDLRRDFRGKTALGDRSYT